MWMNQFGFKSFVMCFKIELIVRKWTDGYKYNFFYSLAWFYKEENYDPYLRTKIALAMANY